MLKEMVRDIKFDIAKKGYNQTQVDEFLDEMLEKVSTLEEQLEKYQEENRKFKESEHNITKALVSAEHLAKRIIDEANGKAAIIQRDAEKAAEDTKIAAEAEAETVRRQNQHAQKDLTDELAEMRAFIESFRARTLEDANALIDRLQCFDTSAAVSAAGFADDDAPVVGEATGRGDSLIMDDEILEPRRAPVEDVYEQINRAAESDAEIDLREIMKNLPESDSELKAMIDEML